MSNSMKLDILSFNQLAAALGAGSSLPELNSLLLVNRPDEIREALSICLEVINRVDLPEVSISAIFLGASLIHNIIRLDYRILLELDDLFVEVLANTLFKSEKLRIPSPKCTSSSSVNAAARQLCQCMAVASVAPSVQSEVVSRILRSVGDSKGTKHFYQNEIACLRDNSILPCYTSDSFFIVGCQAKASQGL
jgi:hypothetical protein